MARKKKDPEEQRFKEILKEEKEETVKPLELRNDPEVQEHFNDIMSLYENERKRIDYEKKTILFLPVLKQKFITMYCSGLYTHKEIARILGVSPNTISHWLRHEEITTAIEAYQKEENLVVDTSLKAIRMKAVNKLSELLDASNEMVQLQATREILDRTGHMAVQKQEVNVNVSYEERLRNLVVEGVDFEVVNDTDN